MARNQRPDDQWRQGEVVHDVGLVAFTEIGDVVGVGHVCFRDEQRCRIAHVNQQTHQFDHLMRLG